MQDVGKCWKRACADGTQRQAGKAGLTPGPESSAGSSHSECSLVSVFTKSFVT